VPATVAGAGNRRGEPISIDEAEDHVFGLCLLNDWTCYNDGDTVVTRGWCVREGHVRIGFGECRGTVAPPVQYTAGGRGHAT
jgi:hypothetical protein